MVAPKYEECAIYVHHEWCNGDCTNDCGGWLARPTREEYERVIAAAPTEYPIPGWQMTAAEIVQYWWQRCGCDGA